MRAHKTETGRRFYMTRGYVEDGPAIGEFGTTTGYPMIKLLRLHKSCGACGNSKT
jgi:hypothetical protein